MNKKEIFVAIDLKSFYASVECRERNLDPMDVNLVVADKSRTAKTICLAVSPALKSFGVPGRPRLFEVLKRLQEINHRKQKLVGKLEGKSSSLAELSKNPKLEADVVVAIPRMKKYMEYSAKILSVYLKYVSPEDIYVYSVDEVFIDLGGYILDNAVEFVEMMVKDVFDTTGIIASAGIGENMYLAKVAMDIVAKKAKPNEHGARIGELSISSYREQLWSHTPITDFWRVGRGYAKTLAKYGIYTMGDIARESLKRNKGNEGMDLLYRLFGKNASFLIEHAWGIDSTQIRDVKSYTPEKKSISEGQVLLRPYSYDEMRTIVIEMAERLSFSLLEKDILTKQITLSLGYDIESLSDPDIAKKYTGNITKDFYGRSIPEGAHGVINLLTYTDSTKEICKKSEELFERLANPILLFRRITIVASEISNKNSTGCIVNLLEASSISKEKENSRMKAVLKVKRKFGNNAIFKGLNLKEEGTALDRNRQIGGHKE